MALSASVFFSQLKFAALDLAQNLLVAMLYSTPKTALPAATNWSYP